MWVNGRRIAEAELADGDTLVIGEYRLRYLVNDFSTVPAAAPPAAARQSAQTCRSCGTGYGLKDQIRTRCGINLKTGKLLVTAKGFDENDLAIRADTWIRIVSIVVWFGLFPIASEAYARYKPRATWIITAITVVVSLVFLGALIANNGKPTAATRNYMLWAGNARALHAKEAALDRKLDQQFKRTFTTDVPYHTVQPGWVARRRRKMWQQAQRSHFRQIKDELHRDEADSNAQLGQFHWYQLLTAPLLHAGLLHLGGNLVFLLVFGLRVNEMIGDLKMAVIYPLLAVLSGGIYAMAQHNAPLHPMIGASGAIMGLAGMYFVFFPLHKVHMAIWFRGWLLTGFRVPYKLWRMPGVWLLLLWIGINDLLPMMLGSADHTAHWAHLGGFASGVVIALGLMVSRQVDANGTDLPDDGVGPPRLDVDRNPRRPRGPTDVMDDRSLGLQLNWPVGQRVGA